MFTLPHFRVSIRKKRGFFLIFVCTNTPKNTRRTSVKIFSGVEHPEKKIFSSPTPLKWQKMFTDLHSQA